MNTLVKLVTDTVPGFTREPGGTDHVTTLTLMAAISRANTHLMLTVSTGITGRATTTPLNELR